MKLIEITKNGTSSKSVCVDTDNNTDLVKTVISSTADLYASVGYMPPWIGYLVFEEYQCVGMCI